MPELGSYSKNDLPRDLAVQVASYVRVQWPQLLAQRTPLWESTPYTPEGRHFVVYEGDVLISHAFAHRRVLNHVGETWNVGGLSSVFTYPTHRGAGQGERCVAAASEWIRNGESDFALLFCGERVSSLYERVGWEMWTNPPISSGDPKSPKIFSEYLVMGMVISNRAREARRTMEGTPLYVGQNTW